MKSIPCIFFSFILAQAGFSVWSQTFSNATAAACNSWDSGNAYTGFQRNITVSGLPSTLSNLGTVLRQVNLELGSSSCTGNMSTYYARLISPSGTTIQLLDPFVSTSTAQWMDIKLRDDASLEPVSTYSLTTQQNYWPWDIGYYRIPTVDGFAVVNGEDPNGTWTLQIAENTSSEISFVRVDLVFGPIITVNDVTGSTANNDCAQATCIDGMDVARATNNGYASGDPNYPGGTVSGCSWNGANNNSSWFMFQAIASSVYLTVSGMYNSSSPTSSDMQLLVVSRSGADCTSGTFSVPSGGCPDDQTTNNMSYISPNGGSSSANVYANGITANCEFNLSGLTAGQMYYLYVDGNGGAPSSFYIEVNSGTEACGVVLPVDLIDFYIDDKNGYDRKIYWKTASEINSAYFIVERSIDGVIYEPISKVEAQRNSSQSNSYVWTDSDIGSTFYYRLKQVDFDGRIRTIGPLIWSNKKKSTENWFYPNPSNGHFYYNGLPNVEYSVMSSEGILVYKFASQTFNQIDLTFLQEGFYIVIDSQGNHQKLIIQK
jgi:hypothetical protein